MHENLFLNKRTIICVSSSLLHEYVLVHYNKQETEHDVKYSIVIGIDLVRIKTLETSSLHEQEKKRTGNIT